MIKKKQYQLTMNKAEKDVLIVFLRDRIKPEDPNEVRQLLWLLETTE